VSKGTIDYVIGDLLV